MDMTLSPAQAAAGELFDSLFAPELLGTLRRVGARELGAGTTAPVDESDAEARRLVWQTLRELGGLPPSESVPEGRLAAQVVLAEKIGAALYQSPWADTVAAMEVAVAAGRGDIASAMADSDGVALAFRDRARSEPDHPGPLDPGTGGRVSAVREFVGFPQEVTWILVVGRSDGGTRLVLVPADHPSVSWHRHDDIGRGDFHQVTVRDVPGEDTVDLSGSDGAGTWGSTLVSARIRHAAYLVGLAQAAHGETVDHARRRRQFGQPIGRFQSLAFRLADAATHIEATRLLVFRAAWQADTGHDARLATLEALAGAIDIARAVSTDAVQLHGAVGMTEDHDAQLFYRRVAVDALLLGRATELRRSAAAILAERYR